MQCFSNSDVQHKYFPNIKHNYQAIIHRPILSDSSHETHDNFSSVQGRLVCLVHVLATPLKALSGIGRLAMQVLSTFTEAVGILTLNSKPKKIKKIAASFIDVPVATLLLPVSLLTNAIRGIAGAILHPKIMIYSERNPHSDDFKKVTHKILYGTLVNY